MATINLKYSDYVRLKQLYESSVETGADTFTFMGKPMLIHVLA